MIIEDRPEYVVHLGKKYKKCGHFQNVFQDIHATTYRRQINTNFWEFIVIDYFDITTLIFQELRERNLTARRTTEGVKIKYY